MTNVQEGQPPIKETKKILNLTGLTTLPCSLGALNNLN